MTSRLTNERIAEIEATLASYGFKDSLLAEVKALKAEKESMAKEYSQRLSHEIDDYYNAWANYQVEMEQLKKQLTQVEAERDVLADACARIVGSPDGQEFPSLVHKGIITKRLNYAKGNKG